MDLIVCYVDTVTVEDSDGVSHRLERIYSSDADSDEIVYELDGQETTQEAMAAIGIHPTARQRWHYHTSTRPRGWQNADEAGD